MFKYVKVKLYLFKTRPASVRHLPTIDPPSPPRQDPYKMQHPGGRGDIVINLKPYSWHWAVHTYPSEQKTMTVPN